MTEDSATAFGSLDDQEIARSLDYARDLIKSGVPIFLAPPCSDTCRRAGHENSAGTGGSGFDLPGGWENAVPMLEVVDRWQRGWAMAAVCGHGIDVLDVDPRNGGDIAAEELRAGGVWPRTYGMAQTPSGGTHELIRSIGVRKGTPYPGIDLQAGAPGGEGRGFVFIAPTVKVSKVDGIPRPYRWITAPDLDALAEWGSDDDSGAVIATAIATVRARPALPEGAIAPVELSGAEAVRLKAYADAAIARELAHLRAATPGSRNAAAFRVACSLIEIANSPWSGVQLEQVLAEFDRAAALVDRPDDRFTPAEAYDAWSSALRHVNGRGRPQPAEKPGGLRLEWSDVGGMPPFSQAGLTPAYSWNSPSGAYVNTSAVSAVSADPFGTVGIPSQRMGSEIDGSAPNVGYPTVALSTEAAAATRRPLRLLSSADLDDLPPVEWLVADLLAVDSTAWIIGRPGRGKSFVSLDLALHIATGKDWHGHAVRKGIVVYVVGEGARGTRQRVRAWEKVHLDGKFAEGIHFIDAAEEGLVLGSPVWAELQWTVAQVRPALIIIDTQARVTVGVDENSAKEMGIVVAEFDRLRRLGGGSTILSVHHQGHAGQQARGSSAMLGAAQTELTVTKKERLVTVIVTKQKDDEPIAPIELHLDSIPLDAGRRPQMSGDPWVTLGKPITGGVLRLASHAERTTIEEILALDNRERIVAVLRDVFGRRGGTKAEIKGVMTKQYEVNEKTFYRIWNELLEGAIIARVFVEDKPTSNYTLRSFDEGQYPQGSSTDIVDHSLTETVDHAP